MVSPKGEPLSSRRLPGRLPFRHKKVRIVDPSSWGGSRSLPHASEGFGRTRKDNGGGCRYRCLYFCFNTFFVHDPRAVIRLVARNLALPFEIKNARGLCRVVFCVFKLMPGRLVKGIIPCRGSGIAIMVDWETFVRGDRGGIGL